METLFITVNLTRTHWYLKDARGALIGTFGSPEEAESWCKEMGYRCRRTGA